MPMRVVLIAQGDANQRRPGEGKKDNKPPMME